MNLKEPRKTALFNRGAKIRLRRTNDLEIIFYKVPIDSYNAKSSDGLFSKF